LLQRSLSIVLAILLGIVLAIQASSLFVLPVPDSIRWFGDESWLMSEAIATVETGELHHPLALSSTLAEPKGLFLINTPWLRTLVYGVPAFLAFPASNPVDTGRLVSFIIGLITLASLVYLVRRRTGDFTLALCAALLLASSQAYLFASHSARFDVLTGLIVLLVGAWVTSNRFASSSSAKQIALLAGVCLFLAIGLPVHLYFHLIGLGMLALALNGRWRDKRTWIGMGLAVAAASGLAMLLQFVITGHASIWDPTSHQAEIGDVSRDIPILKLFSLSSQLSVLDKNASLMWDEAPWLFAAIPIFIWAIAKRSSHIAIAAMISLVVWYFLQRPHPAYLAHVVPLCAFAAILVYDQVVGKIRRSRIALAVAVALLAMLNISFLLEAYANGQELTKRSRLALVALSSKMERSKGKPLVLVEASVTKHFLSDTSIRLMTTHFQFFPKQKESIEATMKRNGVDYAILFNTANYGYDRNAIDPLVRTIQNNGDLIGSMSGAYFDIGRDYSTRTGGQAPLTTDTILLYKMRK
jgi:hypothetical protein